MMATQWGSHRVLRKPWAPRLKLMERVLPISSNRGFQLIAIPSESVRHGRPLNTTEYINLLSSSPMFYIEKWLFHAIENCELAMFNSNMKVLANVIKWGFCESFCGDSLSLSLLVFLRWVYFL